MLLKLHLGSIDLLGEGFVRDSSNGSTLGAFNNLLWEGGLKNALGRNCLGMLSVKK